MVTVFNNFTISEARFPESVGDNVVTDNPVALLLITPNTGYSVLAENFNVTLPLPINVASVSFTQVGNLVECVVTFNDPFIMPANDVEIGLCLTGLARAVNYSVAGLINVTKTNATSSPTNLSFNISENFNSTSVVKTVTLTATSGFYFLVEPTLIQTAGDASIFSIADSKVFDIEGRLLSKTFTISCTMPNYNSLNNIFNAVADGIQIFTPVPSITAYSIRSTVFPLAGEIRDLLIYGGYSGNWTLTTALPILQTGPPDPITGIIPYGTSVSGEIDSTGFSTISIQVPSVTSSSSYSITLSGDLISPFPQSNPIVLNQYGNITITYIIGNSTFFTNNGNKTNSGPALSVPINGANGEVNNFNWDITPQNGYGLMLINQPSVPGFDPVGGTPSSGSNIIEISSIVATQVSSSLITVNVTGSVGIYGTASIDTILDLSGLIAYVDTDNASNILQTTATSGGNIVFTGSSGVIGIRGLCYSTNPLPTVADSTVPGGTGFGAFTSNLTGLTGNTLYYTRAYAYNLAGTIVSYGPEKQFTTRPVALPTTFITNEDTNFTIQLLSMSVGPSPDFIITSLPNTLQGDIYDPGTGLKITTVPYTLVSYGTTVLFDPTLNYFGNVDPFNFELYQDSYYSNVATVTGIVLAVNDSPIFDQPATLYNGIPGGTYTYTGTVSDPDDPSNTLVVTFVPTVLMPSLPSGWTFVQTPGTNQFTLTGPVPSGADYSITLQVTDGVNVTQQQVSANAVFATLSSMEFKLNYINGTVTAGGTGTSPKSTSPIPLSIKPPGTAGHGCNRAQFNLVAGVFANVGGTGTWQWTNLGKGSLNNVTGTGPFNVFESSVPSLALLPFTTTQIPIADVDLAAGGQTDLGNTPIRTYNALEPRSYYVNQNYPVSTSDRTSYFDVTLAEATSLATASNWVGSPNRGIVKFKLIPNSYDNGGTVGILNVHADSSWLQVFKPNSTGTNQEEVLVGGESFLLSNAVVITVNLLTNAVSVGPA